MARFPNLTLILGGASSGKSAFAEELAALPNLPKTYVATAQAFDDEMRKKIAAHRKAREGANWKTIEAPLDLDPIWDVNGVVLIDCLTLWLTNHMTARNALDELADKFLDKALSAKGAIIAVSNEVGLGIVPENKMARQFRVAQGKLNQRIAQEADLVVQVTAGLPLILKGTLPDA